MNEPTYTGLVKVSGRFFHNYCRTEGNVNVSGATCFKT